MTAAGNNRRTRKKSAKGPPKITAYCINPALEMPIVTASQSRAWMDRTTNRFAYRCLPLLIANQSGWFLLNSQRLRITWDGRKGAEGIRVKAPRGKTPELAFSHFGEGVVTWHVPYLFRTSPGYNLLVRGPANWPKDGIYPIEGVVETDWLGATFSINWRMTRVNYEVVFEPGEPVAMIVPQRRQELEAFNPEVIDIESDPAVRSDYGLWETRRLEFLERLIKGDPDTWKQGWEKHYFRGVTVNGVPVKTHQTRLKLKNFEDRRKQ